jgi:DNA helicase-2/ATP-dependent DNA helicase PcrA
LALTFTKAAAVNMRERLAGWIGVTAYKVQINTFHGFCQNVIESNPTDFSWSEQARVVDELTRLEILQSLINNLPLKILRPLGKKYLYLKAIIKRI